MSTRRLTFPLVTRAATGDDTYSVTITTSGQDRMGDVVEPMGCRPDNWLKAGAPILYAHRHDELPIGRGLSLSPTANGIRMSFQFLKDDEFAQRAKNAWRQQALGAASIAFVPVEFSTLPGGRGMRVEEWDLIEVSLTATPANAECVRVLESLGLPVDDADDEVVLVLEDDDPADDIVTVSRSGLEAEIRRGVGRAVAPLVERLRALQHRQWDDNDVALILVDSPDDVVEVAGEDLAALPAGIAASCRQVVAPVVADATRRAVNALRGRVD